MSELDKAIKQTRKQNCNHIKHWVTKGVMAKESTYNHEGLCHVVEYNTGEKMIMKVNYCPFCGQKVEAER